MSARPLARVVAVAALGLLALPVVAGPALAAKPPADDESIPVTVTVPRLDRGDGDGEEGGDRPATLTNAELRWSVNAEALSPSHFGVCNFLMAGRPGTHGDAGGGRVWEGAADADLYHGTAGDVRVLRTVGTGGSARQQQATYATRCSDPTGATVSRSAGTTTGAEVVLAGGTGERAADGSLSVRWKGTFSVVFYGGLTYWWATDPVLTLDADGDGTLRATGGGYGTSRDDMSKWQRLKDTPITLAAFSDEKITSGKGGFLAPDYCGVELGKDFGQVKKAVGGSCWGSFPKDFVAFQQNTGQSSYWYSSGGEADARKVPADVGVSFDAEKSIGRTPTPGGSGTGAGTGGGPGTGAGTGSGSGPGAGAGSSSGTGTSGGSVSGTTTPAASVPGAGAGTAARVVRPASLAAATDAVTPAFPAVAAATLGADGAGLVPQLAPAAMADSPRLALLTTGALLTASGAVVGFRKRWLVLPFRH